MCVHACVPVRKTYLGENKRVRKRKYGVWLCAHIYLLHKYIIPLYT